MEQTEMTDIAQDNFLRRFAEALGWDDNGVVLGFLPTGIGSGLREQVLAWLANTVITKRGTKGQDWLITPAGALFILNWMQDNDPKKNHYFFVTINSKVGGWYVGFINNVDNREGEATEGTLEHAIANAAAAALEGPPFMGH